MCGIGGLYIRWVVGRCWAWLRASAAPGRCVCLPEHRAKSVPGGNHAWSKFGLLGCWDAGAGVLVLGCWVAGEPRQARHGWWVARTPKLTQRRTQVLYCPVPSTWPRERDTAVPLSSRVAARSAAATWAAVGGCFRRALACEAPLCLASGRALCRANASWRPGASPTAARFYCTLPAR